MITIRMANELGILAEQNPKQAISFGVHGKHLHELTETEPICTMVDTIGSTDIDYSGGGSFYSAREDSNEPGVAVRMVYFPAGVQNPNGVSADWTASLGKDVVMVVCAKAINAQIGSNPKSDDSCGTPVGNGRPLTVISDMFWGGAISFYMGEFDNGTNSNIRLQPYYAVFGHDVIAEGDDGQLSTPFYEPMKSRADDETYIFAAVKRGNILEHYMCDSSGAVFTGQSAEISTKPAALQSAWNSTTYGDVFRCGHSAVGTPSGALGSFDPLPGNDNTIVNWEQDFYGFSVSHFVNDAPPVNIMKLGLAWMRREWPKGNKKLYPGWMVYT